MKLAAGRDPSVLHAGWHATGSLGMPRIQVLHIMWVRLYSDYRTGPLIAAQTETTEDRQYTRRQVCDIYEDYHLLICTLDRVLLINQWLINRVLMISC